MMVRLIAKSRPRAGEQPGVAPWEVDPRSEVLEYVVEGLILRFFKHVQFAALLINNRTWLDLPCASFHRGFVLGSRDFGSVARRMSRTRFSDVTGVESDFALIFAPCGIR
jgi:hypothetical protein